MLAIFYKIIELASIGPRGTSKEGHSLGKNKRPLGSHKETSFTMNSHTIGINDVVGERIVRGSLCNGRDDEAEKHIIRGSLCNKRDDTTRKHIVRGGAC